MRGVEATMESPRFGMEVSSNGSGFAVAWRVSQKWRRFNLYIYSCVYSLYTLFSKMSSQRRLSLNHHLTTSNLDKIPHENVLSF